MKFIIWNEFSKVVQVVGHQFRCVKYSYISYILNFIKNIVNFQRCGLNLGYKFFLWIKSGIINKILYFADKKMSNEIKSGKRGGHRIEPPWPIYLCLNVCIKRSVSDTARNSSVGIFYLPRHDCFDVWKYLVLWTRFRH